MPDYIGQNILGGLSLLDPSTTLGPRQMTLPFEQPTLSTPTPESTEDDPELRSFQDAYLSLSRGEQALDAARKAPTWSAAGLPELDLIQGQQEIYERYAKELAMTPEDRYRKKMEEYLASYGITPDASTGKKIGGRIRQFFTEMAEASRKKEKYETPAERLRREAMEEYRTIVPVAQSVMSQQTALQRSLISHDAKIQALQQREADALRRNSLQEAAVYSRLAREQTMLAKAQMQSREIAARIGLDEKRAQLIDQQIANARTTGGLSGEAGFVFALSQLPDEKREQLLSIMRAEREAGRDPLRYAKLHLQQEAANRPRGPFSPIRDPAGNIVAFYSPADNRIITTPAPISDRPDPDQKNIDRANLVTVLTNLATIRRLHEEWRKTSQMGGGGSLGRPSSWQGPIMGRLAILASKFGLGMDQDTAVAQMQAMLKHATRTMIYLMSGKAVSEREAEDFEAIMPSMLIGAKDFDVKLALMINTIANFAQVRFRKSIDQILREEVQISPTLQPHAADIAASLAWARPRAGNLYTMWSQAVPKFAQRYRDYLLNPGAAIGPPTEAQSESELRRRAREILGTGER